MISWYKWTRIWKVKAVACYKVNISVLAWGHLENELYRSQNARRLTLHTKHNHEEFHGVKTAKSKPYASPTILQIVTNPSAVSFRCNRHVTLHLFHRVRIRFKRLFLRCYEQPNAWYRGMVVQLLVLNVTPSCQAPDGWIRDPTLQRTPTPLGSLSPIVTPSHAKSEQNGNSYFRQRIRKPNIHFTSAVCFPFSLDFLLNVSLPAYRYS